MSNQFSLDRSMRSRRDGQQKYKQRDRASYCIRTEQNQSTHFLLRTDVTVTVAPSAMSMETRLEGSARSRVSARLPPTLAAARTWVPAAACALPESHHMQRSGAG